MAIDTKTPEGRQRELRNAYLLQAKRNMQRALDELSLLIHATPTGERRNTLCDANIYLNHAYVELGKLGSEES